MQSLYHWTKSFMLAPITGKNPVTGLSRSLKSTLTSGHLSRCGYIGSYIMGALWSDISFYMVNRVKLLTYWYV